MPKPVVLHYWYGAWRCRASHQAVESRTVAVVTGRVGCLAVGWVPPGGTRKQEAWKAMGAWRRKLEVPGGDGTMWYCASAWRLAV